MRVLKMLGFVGLFLGIWFLAQLIAAVVVAVPMLLVAVLQGQEPNIENLIVSGISWILILSSIMATLFFWVVYILRRKSFFQELKIRALPREAVVLSILAGLGISVALTGIINFIDIAKYFPEATQELAEMFAGSDLLSLLLAVGIIVPIFEELMFRGLIFNEMRRAMPHWLAIVLSGVVFGVAHMNPIQIMYTLPMGILLAILYYRTGSLWTPILVHIAWNICSVLFGLVIPHPTQGILLLLIGIGLSVLVYTAWQLMGYRPAPDLLDEHERLPPIQTPPAQEQPPVQPPNLVL